MNKYIIFLTTLFFMCSCSVYRKYERPENIVMDSTFRAMENVIDTTTIAQLPWKELFHDFRLQKLVEQGLQNNTELQTAQLRVEAAMAHLTSAKLAYLPSLAFEPEGTISNVDGTKASRSYNIGANISWEIDVFGKVSNEIRSKNAVFKQNEAYRQAVQTRLIATIADSYYSLILLDWKIEIYERTMKNWNESIHTLKVLKRAGKATQAAINQAEANKLSVESSILTLKKQIFSLENSLSALLGIPSQSIDRGKWEEQKFLSKLYVGVPLQLLSNRPDVRQCEYVLEEQFYLTNKARAAFYPSIILGGTSGWTNNIGNTIVNPGSLLTSIAISLAQPLFNKGINRTNLKVAKLQQEEALRDFQQKLLDASVEVNDALIQWQTAHSRLELNKKQIDALESAVRNTHLTMQYGNITYLEVLTAEQNLLQAELSNVTDKYDEIQGIINLYHALGGGTIDN